jgi:cobalt-zinc-cadmium efflux system outer membrane protein
VSRWEKDEMKRLLITVADILMLGILLPCIILAEEKQEKKLTGAITLVQAQQKILLRNLDLQTFFYEVRVREAETLQAGLLTNPKLNVRVENTAGSGDFNGFDQSETTVQLS